MKHKEFAGRHYDAEKDYNAAQEKLEALKAIEKERPLDDWEELEKKEALADAEHYGRIMAEQEELERQEICRSQGLSRWC